MKILVLDLEVAPTLATVWGLWNINVGINQIVGNSYILSWAASWLGSDEVEYSSLHMTTNKKMIKEIYKLVSEADVVVGYNLDSFDMKILNKEFALLGLPPPTPYKTIDLLKVVKKRFRFTSNKLDYVAQMFGLGKKTKHQGHELWLSCMNKAAPDYDDAWALMEEYNCNDVVLTERLYEKVKGWIPNHPNHSAFQNAHVCPNCASTRLQKRGTSLTASLTYQRYQCQECGSWSRSKVAEKADRKAQLMGVK
jgi:predicted RNA-binding Zn-ribbon protein involved in translation (DUF1610 family)